VFTVWREYSVESCQVHSRLGNQRGQLGDEIQRFKDDVRSSIAVPTVSVKVVSLKQLAW
jgi:hypothetical protein